MSRSQNVGKLVPRELPFGKAERVEGDSLHLNDGRTISLSETFGQEMFCEMNARGYRLVRELVDEVSIQRKLLMQFLRQEGFRLQDPNEFHRSINSLAGKIGVHAEDLRDLVEPMIFELVKLMLERVRKETGQDMPKNRERS